MVTVSSTSVAKPVVFASEEEIPPWLRGGRVATSVREGGTALSPGFRPVEEDDHVHDVEWILEATDLHYRVRELYLACQHSPSVERFLRAFIEEPLMVDYLEWQPRVAQFLLRRIGYWERTSVSGAVRRLASLVLKAFFLRENDWE